MPDELLEEEEELTSAVALLLAENERLVGSVEEPVQLTESTKTLLLVRVVEEEVKVSNVLVVKATPVVAVTPTVLLRLPADEDAL